MATMGDTPNITWNIFLHGPKTDFTLFLPGKNYTMKNAVTYKGYAARVEFDAQGRIFFGRIAGIRDIVSFH